MRERLTTIDVVVAATATALRLCFGRAALDLAQSTCSCRGTALHPLLLLPHLVIDWKSPVQSIEFGGLR